MAVHITVATRKNKEFLSNTIFMKHSKVHSNVMEFYNHMQCNVDTMGARFKFTAGLLYTFLFQDGMKFYQAEKKGNHTQLLHVTEPTFSSQPRSRIVVIDRHVDDAIALFLSLIHI